MAGGSRAKTAPPDAHWRYRALLLLIALLGLALRVWLWTDQGRSVAIHPRGDQDEYYRGAIHILLQGDYYDEGQWLRPPLTSLFLAAVFAVVGVDLPRALLAQCALSAATVVLLAELARRLFASRRAGLAGAAAMALFLPYADYASQLLSETLFIFTITAALLLLELARQRAMAWPWVLAGGIAWGLATLTRAVGLYAVPLLALWVAWEMARTNSRGPTTHDARLTTRLPRGVVARRALLGGALLVLGFALVVGPWTARNYVVYRQLVLVDTNSGISFWLGNLLEPGERELQFVWNSTLPNSAERQRVALARARANIARAPGTFLRRTRDRTVSLWQLDLRLYAGNAVVGIGPAKRSAAFALASDLQYVALVLLALVGVAVARPGERSLPLLGWPLYGTLLTATSIGHPRLRLPLLVTALALAALPLAHPRLAWARLRGLPWPGRAFLLAGVAIFFLLLYSRAYGPFARSQLWLAASHLGGGAAAIERAIASAPGNYLPYAALGDARREGGDLAGALAAFDQAAARAPDNTVTQLHRLDLSRRLGDREGARLAMERIADTAWETNQVYEWAWSGIPGDTGAHLDLTAPAPGVLRGVYPVEDDGVYPHRWTVVRMQARFDLPDAERVVLLLRADRPDTPVEVFYQGTPVAVVRADVAWQRFELPLPRATREVGRIHQADRGVLELRTLTHVRSTAEPYPRGVAVAGAWLEAGRAGRRDGDGAMGSDGAESRLPVARPGAR